MTDLDLIRVPQWAKTCQSTRPGWRTGEPEAVWGRIDTDTADRCGWCGSVVPMPHVADGASIRATVTVDASHHHATAVDRGLPYPREVDIRLCHLCTTRHRIGGTR